MICPYCNVTRPDHDPRCPKRELGPNMKRLMARFMAVDAVPPGGGMAAIAAFFLNSERFAASARKAMDNAVTAVAALRSTSDFGVLGLPDDAEETIAGELVRRIEERIEQQRRADRGVLDAKDKST